jgi:hypothetical protein
MSVRLQSIKLLVDEKVFEVLLSDDKKTIIVDSKTDIGPWGLFPIKDLKKILNRHRNNIAIELPDIISICVFYWIKNGSYLEKVTFKGLDDGSLLDSAGISNDEAEWFGTVIGSLMNDSVEAGDEE